MTYGLALYKIVVEMVDILADVNLLSSIYWASMDERNQYKNSDTNHPGTKYHTQYKITIFTILICICAPFLIQYSAFIATMADNKRYDDAVV